MFLRFGGSSWSSKIGPKRGTQTNSKNIEQEEARRRATRTTARDNMSSQNALTVFDPATTVRRGKDKESSLVGRCPQGAANYQRTLINRWPNLVKHSILGTPCRKLQEITYFWDPLCRKPLKYITFRTPYIENLVKYDTFPTPYAENLVKYITFGIPYAENRVKYNTFPTPICRKPPKTCLSK